MDVNLIELFTNRKKTLEMLSDSERIMEPVLTHGDVVGKHEYSFNFVINVTKFHTPVN